MARHRRPNTRPSKAATRWRLSPSIAAGAAWCFQEEAGPEASAKSLCKDRRAGLASAAGLDCLLNQYLLADALGLTAIHVNRVLRQLREQKLLTFRDGRVVFHDLARLRHFAELHGGYLDQPTNRP
jgi:Crp-like helix-turn-helix domain